MSSDDNYLAERATFISDQIVSENQWIVQRTGWNLSAQGLMFAAMGLADKTHSSSALKTLVNNMPQAGIALCAVTLLGVIGANLRVQRLAAVWKRCKFSQLYPPPFGEAWAARLGAMPSLVIPFIISILWYKVSCA